MLHFHPQKNELKFHQDLKLDNILFYLMDLFQENMGIQVEVNFHYLHHLLNLLYFLVILNHELFC